MRWPRQCAILVGGLGSRLGSLTTNKPKPLLDCAGRPFLAWIIRELLRFGIDDFVLLAGFQSEQVKLFITELIPTLPKAAKIRISVEPKPAGTGGALHYARNLLAPEFIMINGDSWFDVNLATLLGRIASEPEMTGQVLLNRVADASRYGVVEISNRKITAFLEKPEISTHGLINSGIYGFTSSIFEFITPSCSMERDVLPRLAQLGQLGGEVMGGYFIDIGIPADYQRAQLELPRRFHRKAVFFDRDGVLNEDLGWVGSRDRFRWRQGAKDAIRGVNDKGWHAFVVTNQAGVARGFYTEQNLQTLHEFMGEELRDSGAFIDDWRFCPHHPEAILPEYRKDCPNRKPRPGMILSLLDSWQADKTASLLIGDKETDMEAARQAGIRPFLYDDDVPLNVFLHKISGE